MQAPGGEPMTEPDEDVLGPGMPGWEKATWILIGIYIIIVLVVFWFLGWKELGFPL
jgi:hypothetical protein